MARPRDDGRSPKYDQGGSMRSLLFVLCPPCFVLLLAGCGRHGHQAPAGGADIRPGQVKLKRNVDLVRVSEEAIDAMVETVGFLEAEGQTNIAAGVSGV